MISFLPPYVFARVQAHSAKEDLAAASTAVYEGAAGREIAQTAASSAISEIDKALALGDRIDAGARTQFQLARDEAVLGVELLGSPAGPADVAVHFGAAATALDAAAQLVVPASQPSPAPAVTQPLG